MGSDELNEETVHDDLFADLEVYGGYIRAKAHSMEAPRWITSVRNGYRWITPATGRRKTVSEDDTRTLIRHYDKVEFVPEADAPDVVRQLDKGLLAFTAAGQNTDT